MFHKMKIKGKILSALLLLSLIGFGLICFFSLANLRQMQQDAKISSDILGKIAISKSKDALIEQARQQILSLALDQAHITNINLDRVASQVNSAARFALFTEEEELASGHDGILISSGDSAPSEPSAFSAFSLAPGVKEADVKEELKRLSRLHNIFKFMLFNNPHIKLIYVGTESGVILKHPWTLTPVGYDPRVRGWYRDSIGKPDIYWSAPYVAASYNELVISCCKAITDGFGKLYGVAAADISVASVTKDFISTQIERRGSAFLLDHAGRVIAKEGMSGVSTSWDQKYQTQNLLESSDPGIRALAQRMTSGEAATCKVSIDGRFSYVGFAPVTSSGWSIAVVIPEDDTLRPASDAEKLISSEIQHAEAHFQIFIQEKLKVFILVAAAMLTAIVLAGYYISRRITGPILALQEGAMKIGSGDLDCKLDIRTGDEVQDLALTVNKMTSDLKEYIRNLKETTAAKQRIESDLKVATEIQASMLPRKFPPFPERSDIDIFAAMEPAKEVGGDMYDFFFIDPDRLFICVGDVSGKGVPAAIFMATAKTLMKGLALQGLSPDEILLEANNYLAEENDACMFITVFCGVIDTRTGAVVCCNAGHNPTILRGASGKLEFLKLPKGLPLGTFPVDKGVYIAQTVKLSRGDSMFLYTDGVTEAMNPSGGLFGEEALLSVLAGMSAESSPRAMIDAVRLDVKRHAAGEQQSDDITMLAIRYEGAKG